MKSLLMRSSFLFILLLIMASCVTPRNLERVSEAPSNSPLAAAPHIIVVDRPFHHKSSSYPAGQYVATVTDGHGIYYEAQDKVISTDPIGMKIVHPGGLYIPVEKSERIRSWVDYGGTPIKVIGDVEGLSYHAER